MKNLPLEQQLEALLFVAGRPLAAREIAQCLDVSAQLASDGLAALQATLGDRGLSLTESSGQYELVTSPEARTIIERFLQSEVRAELSKPALETLAIIAYRQPITRSGLEDIRGVSSEQTLKNLILRGLVIEAGKSPQPGKPTLYATSHSFLRHFGLTKPSDLPPIESFENPIHAT